MDLKTITSLQPSDLTVTSIKAALSRIADAKASALAAAAAATAEQAANALTSTSKQRREFADRIEDATADAAQCDALADALSVPLAEARHKEAGIAAAASYAALRTRLAEHEAEWLRRYRVHENAMRALLEESNSLAADIAAHNDAARAFRAYEISGVEELFAPAAQTRFYVTPAEKKAAEKRAQDERDRLKWELLEVRKAQHAERLAAYAESLAAPDPFFRASVRIQTDGSATVKR